MAMVLDEINTRLLNRLQEGVPLVERPFAVLAAEAGIGEEEVLRRLGELRRRPGGVIRQISAIFDSHALGYASSLVAAKVAEDRLDAAAAAINEHPGVSHNYRRNHAFNLWYTIAVPPDSRLGLKGTVQILHRRSGAEATRLLPTLKLYKIGVKFEVGAEGGSGPVRTEGGHFAAADRQQASGFRVTEADKRMIRALQQDLPDVPRPFDAWATEAGVTVGQLLEAAQGYLAGKVMRRFAAVLRHREAGFSANAMGAWAVPAGEQDRFGAMAASFAAVSHCYLRPTYPDWPYSIFTMVHGQSRQECEAVLEAIASATGITQLAALYSTHEYKKVRVRYFLGDIEEWEGPQMNRRDADGAERNRRN